MGWNPAIAHLGCTCVCIIDYKCNYQWFVWWDQNANEGISWAVCSLFAKEDSLLVFSVSSTSAFQEGTCHMIVRTFQIAESRGKGWITQQLSYPGGVEFLKVLRRILQEQLGWERDRGFQKYCYDLSILVTLLRKAGEMLWKLFWLLRCVSLQMDHIRPFFKGHILHLHRESPCKYIAWAVVSDKVNLRTRTTLLGR